jgi:hypothetical protein
VDEYDVAQRVGALEREPFLKRTLHLNTSTHGESEKERRHVRYLLGVMCVDLDVVMWGCYLDVDDFALAWEVGRVEHEDPPQAHSICTSV